MTIPPHPPAHLVARPRIDPLLAPRAGRPLTSVVGEPGAGKTVAVADWATRTGCEHVWLTARASDATPVRFWTRLLHELGRPEGATARHGSAEDLLDDVIAALAERRDPLTVVVDDYHRIARAVEPTMQALLSCAPSTLRVVLVARPDPVLRGSRLRLTGRTAEVRSTDLACTVDETAGILRRAGLRVDATTVELLHARTEGWPAAVGLAAIGACRSSDAGAYIRGFGGDDPELDAYVRAELLDRQPRGIRRFLLRVSVADDLDADLVRAIAGPPAGWGSLDDLASSGVFLHADPARAGSYRLHGLVREALRRMIAVDDPAEASDARRAAARFHAERGDIREAIEQALSADDLDFAAQLVATAWVELMNEGELDGLAPLLTSIPPDRRPRDSELRVALAAVSLQIESRSRAQERVRALRVAAESPTPGALILEALVGKSVGDAVGARRVADRLLDGRWPGSGLPGAARSLVLSIVGTAESWTGDVVRARTHLRAALAAAEEADSPWLRFVATGFLADAEAKCGDLRGALRRVEQTLETARRHGWMQSSPVGGAAVIGALIATLQCRFGDAAELVAVAEAATRRPRDHPERAAISLPRLVILLAQGRALDALDEIRRARAILRDYPADPMMLDTLRAWEARLLRATGAADEADDVLAQGAPGPLVCATIARLRLDRGDSDGALDAVAAARAAAKIVFPSVAVDIDVVHALALRASGRLDAAAQRLESALDVAAPDRLLRPLMSHGDLLAEALGEHLRRGSKHGAFILETLALIHAPAQRLDVSAAGERLTARELEVLGYLPSSMPNEEIARALAVSVNTLKTHVRAIYRKLRVDGRRAAVVRARELRLIAAEPVGLLASATARRD